MKPLYVQVKEKPFGDFLNYKSIVIKSRDIELIRFPSAR